MWIKKQVYAKQQGSVKNRINIITDLMFGTEKDDIIENWERKNETTNSLKEVFKFS